MIPRASVVVPTYNRGPSLERLVRQIAAQSIAREIEMVVVDNGSRSDPTPRLRALETARLAGHPEADVDDDLAEWDYGDLEGETPAALRAPSPGWPLWSGPVPGGETAEHVATRLDRVVARCRAASGRVLVFGHGHSLRALAARWLDLPVAEGRYLRLDTATVSVLGYERGTPVVQRWNS